MTYLTSLTTDLNTSSSIKIQEQAPPIELDGYSQLWSTDDSHSSLMTTDGYANGIHHYLASNYAEMFLVTASASAAFGAGVYGKLGGVTGSGAVRGNFQVGSGNRIIWTGQYPVDIQVTVAVSFTTDGSTQTITMALAKNGVVETKTAIDRYVGTTGTDLGALAVQGLISVSTDDYIELWGKINENNAITITKMNMVARPL